MALLTPEQARNKWEAAGLLAELGLSKSMTQVLRLKENAIPKLQGARYVPLRFREKLKTKISELKYKPILGDSEFSD